MGLQLWNLMVYFAAFIQILHVITKGGGTRPCEALATLQPVEGAYILLLQEKDNHKKFTSTFR